METYLESLSTALHNLCEDKQIPQETAARQCSLNVHYFRAILDIRCNPPVTVLEQLCRGLDVTPNALLMSYQIDKELSYRLPLKVTEVRCYPAPLGETSYSVCPRCGITMEREYQHFCDRCGQRLDWGSFDDAVVIRR